VRAALEESCCSWIEAIVFEPIPLIELDGVKSAGTTVIASFVAEFVIDDILLFLFIK
jgi:hypothetical protein